ncbi:NUDIX domain-containing protein [Streptomyces sp. NPDC014894]|uniref:NUDIX domain-containing protein n=1 Tax=unclassified Streptomyces TaxID=2593676 RepID=UPI0036FA87BF
MEYTAYIASLPRILAGAAMLFRDREGRVLVVEPNYREGWTLPGGTVESDAGETPREAARRETLEEIGLDVEPGALLALEWKRGDQRPPISLFLYDGGVLTGSELESIRLQEEELLSWRLVSREELPGLAPEGFGTRIVAALDALAAGTGPAELVDGRPVG